MIAKVTQLTLSVFSGNLPPRWVVGWVTRTTQELNTLHASSSSSCIGLKYLLAFISESQRKGKAQMLRCSRRPGGGVTWQYNGSTETCLLKESSEWMTGDNEFGQYGKSAKLSATKSMMTRQNGSRRHSFPGAVVGWWADFKSEPTQNLAIISKRSCGLERNRRANICCDI